MAAGLAGFTQGAASFASMGAQMPGAGGGGATGYDSSTFSSGFTSPSTLGSSTTLLGGE